MNIGPFVAAGTAVGSEWQNNTTVQSNLVLQTPKQTIQPLRSCVKEVLERYYKQIGDEKPIDLYKTLLEEFEAPMLESIMRYCRGNQVKAAQYLGISRITLRKKLMQYFGTLRVGKDRS